MFTLQETIELSARTVLTLFVDRPKSWTHGLLAEELYGQHRSALLSSEFVVVREPVDQHATLAEIQARDWNPLLERIPNCGLLVLYSNQYQHRLSANLNRTYPDDLDTVQRAELIFELRQREIEHFVDASNALIRVSGPSILRLPSGRYAKEFLRVGSIQTNKPALDAMFFSMLPYLRDCGAIITETWTISSLSLNASRLLANYSGGSPCRVDMLSRYHDGTLASRSEMLVAFKRAASGDRNILFLISACMSGNLERQCRSTLSAGGVDLGRIRFLSLFRLAGDLKLDHLCDLSHRKGGFVDEGDVDFDEQTVFDIDRVTYFPLRQEDQKVPVKKDRQAKISGAEALKAYAGLKWIALHRDSRDLNGQRLRHHCIYFDVPKLLKSRRFTRKLREALERMAPPPRIIITPRHEAGRTLAEAAAVILEKLGATPPAIAQTYGSEEDVEDAIVKGLLGMASDGAIMVLDDVSISGARLSSLQEAVRRLGFSGRIHYLVGVARPKRLEDWKRHIGKLKYRAEFPPDRQHTVQALECIVMPDWGKTQCPWCWEEEFYRQLVEHEAPFGPDLVKRLELLQNREDSSSLSEDGFLRAQTELPMKLTQNSVFIGIKASHADVIAAVGNRLQRMRAGEDEHSLVSGSFPERRVVDPECYFGKDFNDSILRAAMLRMTTRAEIEFARASDERNRRERARSCLMSRKIRENDLSCELFVAAIRHHLPPLDLSNDEWQVLDNRAHGMVLRQLYASGKNEN